MQKSSSFTLTFRPRSGGPYLKHRTVAPIKKKDGLIKTKCPECGHWFKVSGRVLVGRRSGLVTCPWGHKFNIYRLWGQVGGRRPKNFSREERERRRELLNKVRSRRWKGAL